MKINFLAILGGVAAATIAVVSGGAQAAIVDISAVTATGVTPVTVNLLAGQEYSISWAGIAGGGLYDGYNLSCPNLVCPSSNWRDDFFYTVNAGPDLNHAVIPVNSTNAFAAPGFSSAAGALSAYQSAALIQLWDIAPPFNATGNSSGTAAQPWRFTPGADVTVNFFIADSTRNDNVGGVSLRIDAVPEPATWALGILGIGMAGVALRRARARDLTSLA